MIILFYLFFDLNHRRTPPQINDFCDLLGTPYAPVSKIAPVNREN